MCLVFLLCATVKGTIRRSVSNLTDLRLIWLKFEFFKYFMKRKGESSHFLTENSRFIQRFYLKHEILVHFLPKSNYRCATVVSVTFSSRALFWQLNCPSVSTQLYSYLTEFRSGVIRLWKINLKSVFFIKIQL